MNSVQPCQKSRRRGVELFIRAIGGLFEFLRPGVPSRMNPLILAYARTGHDPTAWLSDLVKVAWSPPVPRIAN